MVRDLPHYASYSIHQHSWGIPQHQTSIQVSFKNLPCTAARDSKRLLQKHSDWTLEAGRTQSDHSITHRTHLHITTKTFVFFKHKSLLRTFHFIVYSSFLAFSTNKNNGYFGMREQINHHVGNLNWVNVLASCGRQTGCNVVQWMQSSPLKITPASHSSVNTNSFSSKDTSSY